MYNLFLDDERIPRDAYSYTNDTDFLQKKWEVIRNFADFVETIKLRGLPEIVSFDHDLCDDHYKYATAETIPYYNIDIETGYHAVVWLLLYCHKNRKPLPVIKIHTMNDEGQENIRSLIHVYQNVLKYGF